MRKPKRSPGCSGAAWRKVSAKVKAGEPNCAYCGKEVRYDVPIGHPDRGTVDHIEPIILGGHSLDRKYLTVACSACQGSKSSKPLVQWQLTRFYRYQAELRQE